MPQAVFESSLGHLGNPGNLGHLGHLGNLGHLVCLGQLRHRSRLGPPSGTVACKQTLVQVTSLFHAGTATNSAAGEFFLVGKKFVTKVSHHFHHFWLVTKVGGPTCGD